MKGVVCISFLLVSVQALSSGGGSRPISAPRPVPKPITVPKPVGGGSKVSPSPVKSSQGSKVKLPSKSYDYAQNRQTKAYPLRRYGLWAPTYSPFHNWWFFWLLYSWNANEWSDSNAPTCIFKDDYTTNDTIGVLSGTIGVNLTAPLFLDGNVTIEAKPVESTVPDTRLRVYSGGQITFDGKLATQNATLFNDGSLMQGNVAFDGILRFVGNLTTNTRYDLGKELPVGYYMFNGTLTTSKRVYHMATRQGYCNGSDKVAPSLALMALMILTAVALR